MTYTDAWLAKLAAMISAELEAKNISFTPQDPVPFERKYNPFSLPIPGWNKRVMTSKDFAKICKREEITVLRMALPGTLRGVYTNYGGAPFICILPHLTGAELVQTEFHELGHYFLHDFVPLYSSTKKQASLVRRWYEIEADTCSTLARAPGFEADIFARILADRAETLLADLKENRRRRRAKKINS